MTPSISTVIKKQFPYLIAAAKRARESGELLQTRYLLYMYEKRRRRKSIDNGRDHLIRIHEGQELYTMAHDSGMSTELLTVGVNEPIVDRLLSSALKEGMTCLDIGANIGYHVVLESKLIGPAGKVVAIEPTGKAFEYPDRNIRVNRLQNVVAHRFAAAIEDGIAEMVIETASNLSRVANSPSGGGLTTMVRSMPVDTFVEHEGIGRVDFLKLDVEGYELEVVLEASKSIEEWRPSILVEVRSDFLGWAKTLQLFSLLMRLGLGQCTMSRGTKITPSWADGQGTCAQPPGTHCSAP
jgi:FkbM family methyltransferase